MKLGTTLMSLWMNFRQVMGATGPPPSTLLNDLVSYWPLNEISGTRADVVGGNDLTDNNTVGSVLRGPEGTVAKTVYASSEYLSRTQTIDYSLGVTASIWFYQATGANVQGRFFQHGGAHYYGGTGTFSLTDGNSTPNLYAGVGDNASIVNATTQSSGLNAWHHVVMWYDPSDKKVRMRLDGQAAVASASGLANHPDPAAGLYNDVVIGRETVVGVYTDALFGPTALWNRLLTTDEQTALFAAGNAARYADVDVGASCIGWWELDEVSGTRVDSHGSNDLTDNNTVGSVNSGPKGVVASFVDTQVLANAEFLSRAAGTLTSTNFTFVCWAYLPADAGVNYAVPVDLNGVGGDAYVYVNKDYIYGEYFGGGAPQIFGNLLGWHQVAFGYDSVETKAFLSLDGGAKVYAGDTDVAKDLATYVLWLGKLSSGMGGENFQQGPSGVWSSALSDTVLDSLFNSGVGKSYADLTAAEKVGLVSYWNLDEQSGVRYDSHGTNHLTDNNTVTSVINAGDAMDGAAASFVAANSEFLSATATLPASSTDFTAAVWFKNTDSTGYQMLMTNGIDFEIRRDNGVYALVGITGGNATSAVAYTGNEWHLALFWLDGTTEYISVDNGTPQTNSVTPANPGTTFRIGARTDGFYFAGQIDEVAIWDRVLTADERAELYALGRGRFYDFS